MIFTLSRQLIVKIANRKQLDKAYIKMYAKLIKNT